MIVGSKGVLLRYSIFIEQKKRIVKIIITTKEDYNVEPPAAAAAASAGAAAAPSSHCAYPGVSIALYSAISLFKASLQTFEKKRREGKEI